MAVFRCLAGYIFQPFITLSFLISNKTLFTIYVLLNLFFKKINFSKIRTIKLTRISDNGITVCWISNVNVLNCLQCKQRSKPFYKINIPKVIVSRKYTAVNETVTYNKSNKELGLKRKTFDSKSERKVFKQPEWDCRQGAPPPLTMLLLSGKLC